VPRSGKGLKVVRRTLADGTVKEYRYQRDKAPAARQAPDSVGALIVAYRQSPEYTALRASTKRNYGYYLRHLEDYAEVAARDMKRRDLLDARDAIAATSGAGAANVFMRVSATLFNWARNREWVEHSPVDRVRALAGGHLAAWTVLEADHAAKALDEPLRRAVILARYTGQRRGDLIAMTWADIDDGSIRVRQQKTGAALVIPMHHALRAEIVVWRRDRSSTHILTSERGQPWKANHLTHTLQAALPRIGLRAGLNIHGLRKLAAAELADAGCSTHEIAAVTGHRSLAMVQLYTASAQQGRLAKAAILRLETAAGKRRKTDR
jgi:integrase